MVLLQLFNDRDTVSVDHILDAVGDMYTRKDVFADITDDLLSLAHPRVRVLLKR